MFMKAEYSASRQRLLAFSLVELSIVLVILGLLVGGVLSGQSLIRASELRSVGIEEQRYSTASRAFRDKYFALPGDITNATSFWGKDNASCAGDPGVAATPGTCNGNGDGQLLDGGGKYETYLFWQHLARGGLLEGSYTGVFGTGNIGGINVAPSKVSSSSWWRSTYGGKNAYVADYEMPFGNQFILWPTPALKPEDAYYIDGKFDDGRPGSGRIMGDKDISAPSCTSNPGQAPSTDASSTYNFSDSSPLCGVLFFLGSI